MKNFRNLVLLLVAATLFSSCLVKDGRQGRGHGRGHHHHNNGHRGGW